MKHIYIYMKHYIVYIGADVISRHSQANLAWLRSARVVVLVTEGSSKEQRQRLCRLPTVPPAFKGLSLGFVAHFREPLAWALRFARDKQGEWLLLWVTEHLALWGIIAVLKRRFGLGFFLNREEALGTTSNMTWDEVPCVLLLLAQVYRRTLVKTSEKQVRLCYHFWFSEN